MKKINLVFLGFLIIFSSISCSNNKGDSSQSLPGGASATFDAENPNGDRSVPNAGCSITTWVNSINSSQNGIIDCAQGGGFAGSGIFTSPYRFEFNGTSTSIGTTVNAQPSTMPSATWIAWVNPGNLNFQHILSIDDHSGSYNRSLLIQNSNWSAFTGTNTTFEATSADMNTWQHIAVVYTPTTVTLYKNGTPYTFGGTPAVVNTSQTIAIGRSGAGGFDYFNGSIAWVAVYPRALAKGEITSSCKALANRFDAVICN